MPADTVKEEEAEAEDGRRPGEEAHGSVERREMRDGEPLKRGGKVREKRARGGHIEEMKKEEKNRHRRKSGGRVPGHAPAHRPDRRARGGGLADTHPTTAAGRMSEPSYQAHAPFENGGGRGKDNKGKNGD